MGSYQHRRARSSEDSSGCHTRGRGGSCAAGGPGVKTAACTELWLRAQDRMTPGKLSGVAADWMRNSGCQCFEKRTEFRIVARRRTSMGIRPGKSHLSGHKS